MGANSTLQSAITMSGSNSTFAWVFPPAPRLNAHTSNNSEAKNLTHAYHVYGSFPIYKEDAIQLEFNTSSPHAEVDIAYECEYSTSPTPLSPAQP